MSDSRAKMQCQVCGKEEFADVVAELSIYDFDCMWMLHNIEQKGGIVCVLTCPGCATTSQTLILECYKERIRRGFVPGFH